MLDSQHNDVPVAQGEITPSDEEIIESFLAGRLNNPIDSVILRVARSRAAAGRIDPEEIIQNTRTALIGVFRDQRYSSGRLLAYVRRVTEIQLLIELRRRRYSIQRNRDDIDVSLVPDDSQNAEEALVIQERRQHGRAILSALGKTCRRLLILRYYRGLSYHEIGRRISVSEGAARVRVFRCLKECQAIDNRLQGYG